MNLLDLPNELLCSLPSYMRNIEEFTGAASTCRKLRDAFHTASPKTILRLAASSAPTFISPHPHFLVMATCRQVADWAVGDLERTERLHEAFQGGVDGLLKLCVEKAGLTLADIRRLHLSRFSVINPLWDKIDKMAGDQWFNTPNFWSGGVSEANTLQTDVDRAVFQLLIYSELFAGSMKANLEPELRLPRFGLETRIEYIKYCVPDWNTANGYEGMTVLPTGPYDPSLKADRVDVWPPADGVSMNHILNCGRWQRLWKHALKQAGPAFEEDWRQELWWNAPQTLGLDWFELVTVYAERQLPEEWRARLSAVRNQIEALNDSDHVPAKRVLTKPAVTLYDSPTFRQEVRIPVAGYWGFR